jgi:RNA polymerase sigma-54 factor
MALETKLYHKLAQQLVMTPQLQQAIKMLQLSKLDLMETIQQELQENPVLEEELETGEVEERVEEGISEEDWDSYLSGSDFHKPSAHREEGTTFESYTPQRTTLSEHLLWQLRLSGIEKERLRIGEAIIGNINDDGYLEVTTEEIATSLGVNMDEVEIVLGTVQDFDPPGVGARNLRECLLLQIKALEIENPLMERTVSDHLNLLEKRDYKGLAKVLGIPIEDVMAAVKVISSLEPRPGRPFHQEPACYIVPDVYVFKVGKEYVVMPNDEGIPRLRLNEFYKDSLHRLERGPSRDYIQEKMRSGSWFIKSIQQRQKTICKVTESIVKFQREFLDKGIRHLKPLILRDVAEDIGMHESTISRVTTNKYVHTPQGIFELKYFFGTGVSSSNGEAAAAESVKDMIRKIIEGEDPKKPHSDEAIMELLKRSGIEIARRTVTKYREAMGILSSSKRARGF